MRQKGNRTVFVLVIPWVRWLVASKSLKLQKKWKLLMFLFDQFKCLTSNSQHSHQKEDEITQVCGILSTSPIFDSPPPQLRCYLSLCIIWLFATRKLDFEFDLQRKAIWMWRGKFLTSPKFAITAVGYLLLGEFRDMTYGRELMFNTKINMNEMKYVWGFFRWFIDKWVALSMKWSTLIAFAAVKLPIVWSHASLKGVSKDGLRLFKF